MKEKTVERLFVFVPPHRMLGAKQSLAASTVVSFVTIDRAGASQAAETPVALLPKAAQVDVVFDTSDVFVAAIDAPKLSEGKLRLALPNLLEDRLLADPADCHFAFTPPIKSRGTTTVGPGPKLPVAAIDRGLMTRALDTLGEAGYRPRAAYDEMYTIPAPGAGVLSVRVDRGRGIARSGKHEGFAFDFDGSEAPPTLALAVRQLGIKRIRAYGRDAARFAALAGALGAEIEAQAQHLEPAAADGAVNLMQGVFAPRGVVGGLTLPRLRFASIKAPLVWLGIAAVAFIAGMNAYWLKLESEAAAVRGQMQTSFRSAFPNAAVVDPVLQTRRELATLRPRAGAASGDDFSVLNARAVQLFAAAPIGSVAAVEYRDGAMQVRFKEGQALDPGTQNVLRAQAIQQGVELRFAPDGSARLGPPG